MGHADPEDLGALEASFRDERDGARRDGYARAFSAALDDLCFGRSWKRTAPGRLTGTEEVLAESISLEGSRIRWLDVGASDGTTTLELAAVLRRRYGSRVYVDTTVAELNATLTRYRLGPLVEYRSARGDPVLVRLGSFGLRLPKSPRRFDLLATLAARGYLACRGLRAGFTPAGSISLMNPRLLEHPSIEVCEVDILEPQKAWRGRFDAVRASNLLNVSAFDDAEIERVLANLTSYLREGGVLVVSRNSIADGVEVEHGSAWRRSSGALVPLTQFGGGSDIAHVARASRSTDSFLRAATGRDGV